MYFSLKSLINFEGNRYELAKACMQYARKVRMLETDEYQAISEKDALVALKAILEGKIKYTMEEKELDDFDEFDDMNSTSDPLIDSNP